MDPILELIPGLRLRRDSAVALHRQIYECVRDAVLRGALFSGTTLPSSRELASHLGVGRNTVIAAYDQLHRPKAFSIPALAPVRVVRHSASKRAIRICASACAASTHKLAGPITTRSKACVATTRQPGQSRACLCHRLARTQ